MNNDKHLEQHKNNGKKRQEWCEGCDETPQNVIDYFTSKDYTDVLLKIRQFCKENGSTPGEQGYRKVWICGGSSWRNLGKGEGL